MKKIINNIRMIASDKFLWWAVLLMPDTAEEKERLLKFVLRYFKRALKGVGVV